MTATHTLDIRPLEPRVRHSTIFEHLDDLDPGAVLHLVNDHDPEPLRYQLDATHPAQYGWTVVQAGPECWEIAIDKRARVIDARPMIARGEEPFAAIMSAVDALETDQILVVYAPFEPVPLEGVLGEAGFSYIADDLGDGDWRVTFARN
jgi:uncharacterized protein (DUF2249 family)